MKFQLETPCEFPRFKFTIHDAGVFVDEAIGMAQINLKKTIAKLMKEDQIEIPKTMIACSHPNKPDQDCGVVMFSMTILPLEEAEGNEVGEAQEEPNHSPYLKKPKWGRSIGDSFAEFSWDFAWNPFAKFFPFILALFCILCVITVIMYGQMFGFL